MNTTGQLGSPNAEPGQFEVGGPNENILNVAGVPAVISIVGFARLEFQPPSQLSRTWRYGGVQFPLAQTSANTLLQDADPALFYALDFYKFVLQQHLGARFVQIANALGYQGSRQQPLNSIVETAVPYNPEPFLQEAQLAVPLLAIYRVSSENKYRTVAKSEERTTWEFALVLPAMDAAQSQALMPIFHAAAAMLANRTEQACDDAYTPPGGVQRQQWTTLAGITEIHWMSSEQTLYPPAKGLPMPVLLGKLLLVEDQGPYLGNAPFRGSNVNLGVFDQATQSTIESVVDTDTWVPVPPNF